MKAFFVAGTDTEIGKTYSSCRLLELAASQGLSTLGLKPVAAGGENVNGELQNEDAQALMASASISLPYSQVNPVMLPDACSPHIAAANAGKSVIAARIEGYCKGALLQKPDFALIEGAGGWRVPISPRETMADIAIKLNLPVILVVGLRLGCINHALLTVEAIRRDGLSIAGWVGNQLLSQPMGFLDENVQTLKSAIGAPCIGILPFGAHSKPNELSNHMSLNCLGM